jgi:hypothetical protein
MANQSLDNHYNSPSPLPERIPDRHAADPRAVLHVFAQEYAASRFGGGGDDERIVERKVAAARQRYGGFNYELG